MWLTTPWLLAGLGLLAWPVAAHLMSRRARRVVVFPSVALLAEAAVKQGRGLVVRRWLLLMLRSLAVAAVVLAFCRPMVAGGANGAGASGDEAVVVVLDAGASMGWRLEGVGGATGMTLGKAAADAALAEAEASGAPAGLVVTGATTRAVFDRPTQNVPGLRAALAEVEATAGAGDLAAGLAEGTRLLGEAMRETGGRGRLVVVSDLQAATWEAVSEAGLVGALPGAGVEVVDATGGRDWRGNAGVVEVAVEPREARPGEAAVVSAVVRGWGLPGTRAELWVDGQRVEERGVRFDAASAQQATGAYEALTFPLPAGEAGAQRGIEVRLLDDGLAADDAGYAVATTRRAAGAWLVGAARDKVADARSAGYYVARALAPRSGDGDRYALTGSAEEARLAIVAGDAAMSAEDAAALAVWVRGGGGLVVVSDASSGDALSALAQAGLLPTAVGDWRPVGGGAGLVAIALDDAATAGFGAAAWSALERAAIGGWWATDGDAVGGARVLAVHDDGSAAVAAGAIGSGRVAWVNASVVPGEGGLGRSGAWVGLVQALAAWAADGGATSGEMGRGLSVGATMADAGRLVRVDEPGVVRVGEGTAGERWVAVNVEPGEGEAARWDAARAEAWLVGEADEGAMEPVAASSVASDGFDRGVGEPVWGLMLLIGALLLATEAAVVGWWRGR